MFLILNKKEDWNNSLNINIQCDNGGISINKENIYQPLNFIHIDGLPAKGEISDLSTDNLGYMFTLCDGKLSAINIETTNIKWCIDTKSLIKDAKKLTLSGTSYYLLSEYELISMTRAEKKLRWRKEIKNCVDLSYCNGCIYLINRWGELMIMGESGRIAKTIKLADEFGKEAMISANENKVMVFESKRGKMYFVNAIDKSNSQYNISMYDMKNHKKDFKINSSVITRDDEILISGLKSDDTGFIGSFTIKNGITDIYAHYIKSPYLMSVNSESDLIVYDSIDKKIIVAKKGVTYKKEGEYNIGRIYFKSINSTEAGMMWHRFVMDADIDERAYIKLKYYISDEKNVCINGLSYNLDELIDNAEVEPNIRANIMEKLCWEEIKRNAVDALVSEKKGKFMWISLELGTNADCSPKVRSIKVHFPRVSYLEHLPEIYRENNDKKVFLEKYMALFETRLSDTNAIIDNITRYLDIDSVPEEFVRWLATWLDISYAKSWDAKRLRTLIKKAPYLYTMRGTPQMIIEMIEIFSGDKPRIIEYFEVENKLKQYILEDRKGKLPGLQRVFEFNVGAELRGNNNSKEEESPISQYIFCVLMKPNQAINEAEMDMIRKIIEIEKPAHTVAKLVEMDTWICLDEFSYLGVNSYLKEPEFRLIEDRHMSRDCLLLDVDNVGRVEDRSRVSIDTVIH